MWDTVSHEVCFVDYMHVQYYRQKIVSQFWFHSYNFTVLVRSGQITDFSSLVQILIVCHSEKIPWDYIWTIESVCVYLLSVHLFLSIPFVPSVCVSGSFLFFSSVTLYSVSEGLWHLVYITVCVLELYSLSLILHICDSLWLYRCFSLCLFLSCVLLQTLTVESL